MRTLVRLPTMQLPPLITTRNPCHPQDTATVTVSIIAGCDPRHSTIKTGPLGFTIFNYGPAPMTISQIQLYYNNGSPAGQYLQTITLAGGTIWSGNIPGSPAAVSTFTGNITINGGFQVKCWNSSSTRTTKPITRNVSWSPLLKAAARYSIQITTVNSHDEQTLLLPHQRARTKHGRACYHPDVHAHVIGRRS